MKSPSTSPDRLHGLDHLRALAITLVFLFHYQVYYGIPKSVIPQYIDPIIQFGWSGVDLFFVLSGYLIASKVFSGVQKYGQVNLIAFYFNRALRIFPAFFGAVAIYFAFPELQEGRASADLALFDFYSKSTHRPLCKYVFARVVAVR